MHWPVLINGAEVVAFIKKNSYSISLAIIIRPLSKNVSINGVKPAFVILDLSHYLVCLELEPLDSLFLSSQLERNLSE